MHEHLAKTAKQGDRRTVLEALRDRLAEEIDDCTDNRVLPALALRLSDVLLQLDDLPSKVPNAPADVIAARRNARRAQPS